MAMTSAGVLVKAEIQETKQLWNAGAMIMGGRAVRERPEATQKIELLLAEPRDIGEGLRPSQHSEQAQEQDLVERIDHLPGLPVIRHVFEVS